MREDEEIDFLFETSYIDANRVIKKTKELRLKTERLRVEVKAARLHLMEARGEIANRVREYGLN